MTELKTPLVLKDWQSGSPSQENTFALCKSRWWYEKRTHAARDESPQTQRGTLLHEVMEAYLLTGTMPNVDHIVGLLQKPEYKLCRDFYVVGGKYTDLSFAAQVNRLAVGGATYLHEVPAGADRVERGFLLQTPEMPVPYRGFIDLLDNDGVVDHKLRAAAKYVKYENDLLEDPQLRIYSAVYAAIMEADPALAQLDERGRRITKITEPKFVDLHFRHVNYCWQESKPVEVDVFVRADQARELFQKTIAIANEMWGYAQISDPREIPTNTDSCNAFFKPCPHMSLCREHGKIPVDPETEFGYFMLQTPNATPSASPKVPGEKVSFFDLLTSLPKPVVKPASTPPTTIASRIAVDSAPPPPPPPEPPIERVVSKLDAMPEGLNPPNGVPIGEPVVLGEFDKDRAKGGPYIDGGRTSVKGFKKQEYVDAVVALLKQLEDAGLVPTYDEWLDSQAISSADLASDAKATVGALKASLTLMLRVLSGQDERLCRLAGVDPLPKENSEARQLAAAIERTGKAKSTQLVQLMKERDFSDDFMREINRNFAAPLEPSTFQGVLDMRKPPEPEETILAEEVYDCDSTLHSEEELAEIRRIVEKHDHGEPGFIACGPANTAPYVPAATEEVHTGVLVGPGAVTEPAPAYKKYARSAHDAAWTICERILDVLRPLNVAERAQLCQDFGLSEQALLDRIRRPEETSATDLLMLCQYLDIDPFAQPLTKGEPVESVVGQCTTPTLYIDCGPQGNVGDYLDEVLRPIEERLAAKNKQPYGAVAYGEDFKQMAAVLRGILESDPQSLPAVLRASRYRRDLAHIREALTPYYIVVE